MDATRIETILVPVDGSKNSLKAIQYAANLARGSDATIHLLHVLEGEEPHDVDAEQRRRQEAESFLEEMRMRARLYNVPTTTRVSYGPVPETIVRVAEEDGFDLIVMGTRGKTPYGNVGMGHVSEIVADRAHCPVLLVR
jgi:nucleotide-binding universal stress UspA family protein